MTPLISVVLSVTLSCVGSAGLDSVAPSTTSSKREGSPSEKWERLLACAEAHTAECKATIEEPARATKSNDPSTLLAAVLLEEWNLAPDAPSLARARRVWISMPTPSEMRKLLPAEIEYATIVVSGVITAIGSVESVVIVRPSKYEELNRRVSEEFSRARYRPAWGSGGFVSQRVEYVYRLEPR